VSFDFDKQIDRRQTQSYKWDQTEKLFGSSDILPLWVADMDFESPPAAVEALKKRAAHGIFGYSFRTDAYTASIKGWYKRRHQWEIQSNWLTDLPGVVAALSVAVNTFTDPGDKIILQTPVYYPFYEVIRMNDRVMAKNPLILKEHYYEINFEHLETLLQEGAKMLLLCHPHNPGGRVWQKEELIKLGELCLQYNCLVVSDEIHGDLVFRPHQHIPFASISEAFAQNSITCLAPSKTFNLPGLQTAFTVIPNPTLKRAFDHKVRALSMHMVNNFGPIATMSCYNEGEAWLDEVLSYIKGNVEYATQYLEENLPQLKAMKPDGTYLLWVDCRGLGLDVLGLKELMFNKAKVAFSDGSVFGEEGEGFIRVNLACPRSTVIAALERFRKAINSDE
jgi:cystathionine beta-lyase